MRRNATRVQAVIERRVEMPDDHFTMIQCTPAGEHETKVGTFIAKRDRIPVSPVFPSMYELSPWMRQNGWECSNELPLLALKLPSRKLCIRTESPESTGNVLAEIKKLDKTSTVDAEKNPVTIWVNTFIPIEDVAKLDGVNDVILAH